MQYLYEGTWSFPSTHQAAREFETLMSKPLTAKAAIEALYPLFGTDALFDALENVKGSDDVRNIIKRHMKQHLKDGGIKKVDITVLNDLRKQVGLDVEEVKKTARDLAREQFFDEWAAFNIEKYKRVSVAADAFERYLKAHNVRDKAEKIGMTPGIGYSMISKLASKFNLAESELTEAPGKVHSVAPGSMGHYTGNFSKEAPKKGHPPINRARAFDKPGTNRSVLFKAGKGAWHGIEYSVEEDENGNEEIQVLMMRDDVEPYVGKHPYYGINVLFTKDGKAHGLYASGDTIASRQWSKQKNEIVAAAKKALKDPDLSGAYDGLGGASVKRGKGKLPFDVDNHQHSDYHGYHDPKTNESKQMITFKQFLDEAKPPMKRVKEPGWYVVDNMDKPIEGPMSESGARERAAEMNAGKKGGDIPEFDVLHFDADDIRRMSRAEKY